MQVRCTLCGKPAAPDNEEVQAKLAAHREAGKAGKEAKVVWICPECSGRARHEAEKGGKGLRKSS